jgi:hypothetical protein
VCNGVIETPQFLLFPIAKGEKKTIAHLLIADGLSFFLSIERRTYDCELRNEKKCIPSTQRIFTAHI